MARPLTKVTRTGAVYVRPAPIEGNIDGALTQDLAMLRRRLQLAVPGSSDYLSSECLVHLVRDSTGRGDHKMRDTLVLALLARCEANLKNTVPDSHVSNAETLREDILQEFAMLLANDGATDSVDELDYFECRFNQAFTTFRINLLRSEQKLQNRFDPLPSESVNLDEEVPRIVEEALSRPATQLDSLARYEWLNALPAEVRKAFVLCYEMGYEVESNEPTKTTAATICEVTGRTIRNRLRRAAENLSQYIQEDI